MAGKMHADEVETDAGLVKRLLAAQFPQWADLTITRIESSGTDNAIYRLGADLAVRMPRIGWAAGQVEKEMRWLPGFAAQVPLAIPVPLAKGEPSEGYPWSWGVYGWLEGRNATLDTLNDPLQAAADLAQFIRALQRIDTTGGPRAGAHNSFRGVPLRMRDDRTRDAIARLTNVLDTAAITAVWEAALEVPDWEGAPVWIHGDLQAGNLLARDGRLSAVIDFGCLGVGDPAGELIAAWHLFTGESRAVFRAEMGVDAATWARGRGWALSVSLVALPYYQTTNPALADQSRRTIEAVMRDVREHGA